MNKMLKAQIINKLILDGTPQEIAWQLVEIGEYRKVKTKRLLVNIGDYCNEAFFVLEGGFVSQYLQESGDLSTISFHLHNFQSIYAIPNTYFLGEASSHQLKAFTDSSVLCIAKHEFKILNDKDSNFKDWYNEKIITSLLQEYKSKTNLISLSNKKMYNYLIKEHPEVIQQVPSRYIAQYLGISCEHLSRIRKQLDF